MGSILSLSNLSLVGALTVFNTLLLLAKAIISYRLTKQLEHTRMMLSGKMVVDQFRADAGLEQQKLYGLEIRAIHVDLKALLSTIGANLNLLGDDITRMGVSLRHAQTSMQNGIDVIKGQTDANTG